VGQKWIWEVDFGPSEPVEPGPIEVETCGTLSQVDLKFMGSGIRNVTWSLGTCGNFWEPVCAGLKNLWDLVPGACPQVNFGPVGPSPRCLLP
jgi:hypothetical protein